MPSAAAVRLQVLKSQTHCPSCGAKVQVRCLAYRHQCPDLRGPRKKRTVRELTEEEAAVRAEQFALKASGTFLRRIAARAPSTDDPADGAEPVGTEGEN
jgi:UDP-N-acetyl-D-mannosaminuronate dehydrogenase